MENHHEDKHEKETPKETPEDDKGRLFDASVPMGYGQAKGIG